MSALKLVVIGGGSSYTPELADGIIRNYKTLPIGEIRLVDIPEGIIKVQIICAFIKRMFEKAQLKIRVDYTLNRREALEHADFVISQFRQGGLKARSEDEKIPLKYHVIGQETTGAGGFCNALRTIPEAIAICKDMEEVCPDAWLINFTNPSGIVTEAIQRNTKIKCVGLCNVPINMEREVCKSLGCPANKVQCRFSGLNHLSFISNVFMDGVDVLKEKGCDGFLKADVVKNIPASEIPPRFMNALGFIPSPYLRYFYLEGHMLKQQLDEYKQTGKTRADEVMKIEKDLFVKYKDVNLKEKPEELSKRGGALYSEAAISLINSIYNDRRDIQVVNTANRGSIHELPDDAVIETDCVITKNGPMPLAYGNLPDSIKGLVQQVKMYERLTVEAAVTGSKKVACLALVNNPLILDAEIAMPLLEEMIKANHEYLAYLN